MFGLSTPMKQAIESLSNLIYNLKYIETCSLDMVLTYLRIRNSLEVGNLYLKLGLALSFNNRKKPEETQSIIRDLTVRLHDILDPKNIEFLLYVIPDKETVYTDFFDSKKLPASFLEYDSLPLEVISPVNELKHAVNKGEMEVFKYSDTHLGESGARIVGQHLQAVLNNL